MLVSAAACLSLTSSEFIRNHTTTGWVLLGIYLVLCFTFMFRWLGSMSNETVLINILKILVVCTCLLYIQSLFVLELITCTFMPDPSKGLTLMNVYSLAEKKALQDDLAGAIAEYEKVIAEEPEDITARLRLAELCCENAEYKKAVMAYEALLARAKRLDANQYCTVHSRLSDIYAARLADREAARKHVRAIIEKYLDSKYAQLAEDRLATL